MADKRDYYEVLGVDRSADEATLKRAYRSLAKKYHPDMNPGDKTAEEKFKEVNEAYSVLSDAEKRRQYDQFGHAAFEGGGGGGYSAGFDGVDLGDIFSSFFGGGFGGGGRRNGPMQGDDVGTRVTVTFDEAVRGCRKDVSFNHVEACPDCHGSGAKPGSGTDTCSVCRGRGTVIQQNGFFQTQRTCAACGGTGKIIRDPCTNCRGKGYVKVGKKIAVTIPAGIDNGQRVVLRGEGNAGRNGGPAGDLIIEVTVQPHKLFERDGNDIYCQVPVPFAVAALGGEILIPTLDGEEKFTVPEGTQPGTSFTLRGRGIPYVNNPRAKGNLYLTVTVEVPQGLSAKQKDLLTAFAESCGESNNRESTGFLKKLRDLFKK